MPKFSKKKRHGAHFKTTERIDMDARFEVGSNPVKGVHAGDDEIAIHLGQDQIIDLIKKLLTLLHAAIILKKGDRKTAFSLKGKIDLFED